jgi:hypothetical protein
VGDLDQDLMVRPASGVGCEVDQQSVHGGRVGVYHGVRVGAPFHGELSGIDDGCRTTDETR